MIHSPGGVVRALWSSFSAESNRELVQFNRGIPAELVAEALKAARSGEPLYSLEAEYSLVPLASARQLGVPENWLRRIEAHSPTRRQVLSVARVVAGSPAVGGPWPTSNSAGGSRAHPGDMSVGFSRRAHWGPHPVTRGAATDVLRWSANSMSASRPSSRSSACGS